MSLNNETNKHRVTIGISEGRTMKVYFPGQIINFAEVGNRSWGLIPYGNSFFKECDKAEKKVAFKDEVEVMRDKMLPALRWIEVQKNQFDI